MWKRFSKLYRQLPSYCFDVLQGFLRHKIMPPESDILNLRIEVDRLVLGYTYGYTWFYKKSWTAANQGKGLDISLPKNLLRAGGQKQLSWIQQIPTEPCQSCLTGETRGYREAFLKSEEENDWNFFHDWNRLHCQKQNRRNAISWLQLVRIKVFT